VSTEKETLIAMAKRLEANGDIDDALQKAHRDTSKYIGTGKLIRQTIGGGTSDSSEGVGV